MDIFESDLAKLEKKVNDGLRIVKDLPKNANAHFRLASDLVELGTCSPMERIQCYRLALEHFNEAIQLAEPDPKKLTTKSMYLADRSSLHVRLGDLEAAVQDIRAINEIRAHLPLECNDDEDWVSPIYNMYVQNTLEDILQLDSIHSQIQELVNNKKIEPEVANALLGHTKIISKLSVQVGDHSGRLDNHDNRIQFNTQDIQDLKTYVSNVVEKLENSSRLSRQEMNELIMEMKNKINIKDIQPYVFTVPQEISQDEELKEYYYALNDTLNITLNSYEDISSGLLKNAGNSKVKGIDVVGSLIASLAPDPGSKAAIKAAAKAATAGANLVISNKTKIKALRFLYLDESYANRRNILHKVGIQVALGRKHALDNIGNNQELNLWKKSSQGVLDKAKNTVVVNMDQLNHKTDLRILGHLDAKKIIWAITHDEVPKGASAEEKTNFLIGFPDTFGFKEKQILSLFKKYKKFELKEQA